MGFVQSERGQGPIYIIKRDNQLHLLRRLNQCCKKQINCIGSIEFLRPYPVRTSISLNPSPTLTKKGVLSGSSHWKPLQGVLLKKKTFVILSIYFSLIITAATSARQHTYSWKHLRNLVPSFLGRISGISKKKPISDYFLRGVNAIQTAACFYLCNGVQHA